MIHKKKRQYEQLLVDKQSTSDFIGHTLHFFGLPQQQTPIGPQQAKRLQHRLFDDSDMRFRQAVTTQTINSDKQFRQAILKSNSNKQFQQTIPTNNSDKRRFRQQDSANQTRKTRTIRQIDFYVQAIPSIIFVQEQARPLVDYDERFLFSSSLLNNSPKLQAHQTSNNTLFTRDKATVKQKKTTPSPTPTRTTTITGTNQHHHKHKPTPSLTHTNTITDTNTPSPTLTSVFSSVLPLLTRCHLIFVKDAKPKNKNAKSWSTYTSMAKLKP